jgi:hypothetical protein
MWPEWDLIKCTSTHAFTVLIHKPNYILLQYFKLKIHKHNMNNTRYVELHMWIMGVLPGNPDSLLHKTGLQKPDNPLDLIYLANSDMFLLKNKIYIHITILMLNWISKSYCGFQEHNGH